MKHWNDRLSEDVKMRLAECRTIKKNLRELVDAKFASYQESGKNLTREDALISVLEMLDCNGKDFGADMTSAEYDSLAKGTSRC